MGVPNPQSTVRRWRIDDITPDFQNYGVWDLPTPGGRDDFPRLVQLFAGGTTADNPSRIARLLFAIRWKLGALLGWDDADSGIGRRVDSLRSRLPADLRRAAPGPAFSTLPFTPVFLLENESAAEMANSTMHGVLHLRWVPDQRGADGGQNAQGDADGAYHGQLAVLVKPNGLFGRAYMAGIKPFRHLLVYPPLLRGIGREWQDLSAQGSGGTA
ncbi:DUF2867 domain-containing protein [Arthrobacter sp. zg-Y916]|uniref:DUF2867 domain-containing protein n=1 Tax=Arthrobacter caoxuetaonis TaxID=2886935 RepID=A0A9X1MCI4_9MICC|nr:MULTISPECIES: DUF2867 domain-containing protein [Arthrobacter]MCC3297528.1 DUF2867 domain-containing protein [Arthrobacter caoxuetaonis]MCC9194419.1 DUF2867 domain-containing protein [Arthrobacter sp. zg-Y916]USQ57941.1 DUF2867 domain-containing protein [Arthrobacter caoxuetaonis]